MTACAHLLGGSGNLSARALKLLTIRGFPPGKAASSLEMSVSSLSLTRLPALSLQTDKSPQPLPADRERPQPI